MTYVTPAIRTFPLRLSSCCIFLCFGGGGSDGGGQLVGLFAIHARKNKSLLAV